MSPLTESTRVVLAKGQPVPNDPSFAFTSLLLHGEGANGSTTITDSSSSPKTVTAFGSAQISTTQSKFGGSSVSFDGTGDYLTAPSSTAFEFEAADFTIEGWFYQRSTGGLQLIYIKRNLPTLTVAGIALGAPGGVATFWAASGLSTWNVVNGVTFGSILNNTWTHLAVVRNGNSFTGYLNGIGTSLATSSSSLSSSTALPSIGGDANGANGFNGYIDELRVTKGVARYTSNFTPPTAPFPDF